MRVELPPTFYWDRLSRDLPTGTLVREKSRTVVVDLSIAEALDVQSDADYYCDPGVSAEMIGDEPAMLGLVASARATLRRITAALAEVPAEEIEAAKVAEQIENERRMARLREEAPRIQAEADRRRAEREAERAAHPRLRTAYTARIGLPIPWTFGLKDNTDLKVGAILVLPTLTEYEIIDLGDEHRGDYPATVRTRDGEEHAAKIEVAVIRR